MATANIAPQPERVPELLGQTVVVIGGSGGIGFEVGRRAGAEGAGVIVTGRDPGRLQQAAGELGARSSAAFDATDAAALRRFFEELPKPVDHVVVTAGRPKYGRLADLDYEQTRRALEEHLMLTFEVARNAMGRVRPGARSCSWVAPVPAVPAWDWRSSRRSPRRCPPSSPTWRSSSPPSASI